MAHDNLFSSLDIADKSIFNLSENNGKNKRRFIITMEKEIGELVEDAKESTKIQNIEIQNICYSSVVIL